MRTTYKSQNVPKPSTQVKEQIPKEVQSPIQNSIVQGNKGKKQEYISLYKTMVEEAEMINSVGDAFDNANKQTPEPIEEVRKPKKKKKFPIVLLFIILLIALAVVGVLYAKKLKSKKQSDFEALSSKVSRLYTDEGKTDVKSDISQEYLQGIYEECYVLYQEGIDIKNIEEELNTVSMFIGDKTTVLSLSDINYDFRTEGFLEQLSSIKNNTSNYKVSGLALTITNMVSVIQSEYDSYSNLLSELQGITDFENLDTEKYEGLIRGITHEPNKAEVAELYATVLVKHTEEVNKKKLEDKAKKKADKAKDDALSKAESAKEEAEKAKEEAEKKLDELLNKSTEEASTENNEEASTEVKSE